jgi:hypothetical protein
MAREKQKNDEVQTRPAGLRLAGCLLAPILYPFRVIFRQIRLVVVLFVISFGACAACGIFAPWAFEQIINTVRNAGLKTYVFIASITGNPALKIVTYEATVTGFGIVNRDMGILGLLYGQGAKVEGAVKIALGADLKNEQFGILSCEVDTDSIRMQSGSAPLAPTAFDVEQIEREAYKVFKEEAARQAIEKYWGDARRGLQSQFASWALGLNVPEVPDQHICPDISTP